MKLLLYSVSALIWFLPLAEALQCYSCSNVTSTDYCITNVTCQQGQKCYTSTHGVGTSQTFNLGCKSENDCLPGGGGLNIVGRSTDSQNDCFQCCQVDNCNHNICSSGLQVINEVGQCIDDPTFDCAGVSSLFNICMDVHHAKLKCRKYCGLCNLVDGSWSEWSSWSQCDVTCGSGHLTRTRTCSNPSPAHGGLNCVGDSKQMTACVLDVCPVHGGWSLWSPWGYCSVTCGIGLERRDRSCTNPYPSRGGESCYGDSRDDRSCFVKACADGLWSTWSNWGSCSATCLGGLQKRVRTCNNPAPTDFGHDCVGNSEEYQTCNNKECRSGLPVSFRASHVSNLRGASGRTLIFANTEINEGDGYDNTTGKFTAPESGIYSVGVQICAAHTGQTYYVGIIKDGHTEASTNMYDYYAGICENMNAVLSLDKNNTIWVKLTSSYEIYEDSYTINMFYGTKIHV